MPEMPAGMEMRLRTMGDAAANQDADLPVLLEPADGARDVAGLKAQHAQGLGAHQALEALLAKDATNAIEDVGAQQ